MPEAPRIPDGTGRQEVAVETGRQGPGHHRHVLHWDCWGTSLFSLGSSGGSAELLHIPPQGSRGACLSGPPALSGCSAQLPPWRVSGTGGGSGHPVPARAAGLLT